MSSGSVLATRSSFFGGGREVVVWYADVVFVLVKICMAYRWKMLGAEACFPVCD